MSQEIRVLHCFNCDIFQVDIVKKAKKWKCRVCDEQQTVRKVHFRGTGLECRTKAQELNMQKGKQQKNELDCLLALFNNAEANHDKTNKGNNDDTNCILHDDDIEGDEIIWNKIDDAQNNAMQKGHHLENKPNPTKEETCNMFNFSNTQKWSKGNMLPLNSCVTTQKTNKPINVGNNNVDSYNKKISKWDSYV